MKKPNYLSKATRKYVKKIPNDQIRKFQESIYARYINIENIKKIKKNIKKPVGGFENLQRKFEKSRSTFFTSSSIAKKSSVYFSPKYDIFTGAFSNILLRPTTREGVKKVVGDFQETTQNGVYQLFMHLICGILGKVDSLTLTNFRTLLRSGLEKQYEMFSGQFQESNKPLSLKKSEWYHLSDLIIEALKVSKIIIIRKKLGPRKKTFMVDYISLDEKFKGTALAYDFRSSNMPLISRPVDWEFSEDLGGARGGFLIEKTNLITYNKEKSLMTRVGWEVLDNINYLQQVAYKINRPRLKSIIKDFGLYLESEDILIHNYKDINSFINEENKLYTSTVYRNQLTDVRKIIETIEQGLYLSHFPCFYFAMYLDFRTRTYYHGWPLNPQGDKLSRELLMFKNQKLKSVTNELDVSASGVQVIGGLLYNTKYLLQTNFIKRKGTPVYKKFDIYEKVCNEYFQQKKTGSRLQNEAAQKYFTRKIFKGIMMCYFYNETHFGVLKKLSEKDFTQIRGFQLSPEITLIREFLNKHFYDFRVLSEIVKKVTSHSVKSQRKISLFEGKVTTYQYYAQQETISINYYDKYDKRQQINVSVDKSPLVIAKGKTERATLPNLVHNIDSIVLHSVVSRAKKLNIPLTVIHDCFIIHKKYENKIKQYYFESFCQEVFNSDNCVLTSFIKRNIAHKELIKDVKLKEILKELENRRRVFSLENYEMSPFILSE